MKWIASALLLGVTLGGCAPDISAYTPIMDPRLEMPTTAEHLKYCQDLVASLPQPSLWGSIASQAGATSGNAWVTAAELATPGAAEAAAGATIVGSITGAKSGLGARQAQAESRVNKCMRNYGEPLLDD